MLRDHHIQELAGQLRSVDQENRQHHENLSNLLQNFQSLLENYNLLRSDYEEEKEAREKYKKIARGQVWLYCIPGEKWSNVDPGAQPFCPCAGGW